MSELSKQDIKEVFVETLEPFAKAVQDDFGLLKTDVGALKVDMQGVKTDVQDIKIELQGVKTDVGELKADIKGMKENFGELFTKLDKFIALYEKQEQELLLLGAQLRRLEERVGKLETKQ